MTDQKRQGRRHTTFSFQPLLSFLSRHYQVVSIFFLWLLVMPPWRNRLARSAVNRKVGGSSPPGGENLFCFFLNNICFYYYYYFLFIQI